jgi:hypothetical protein
MNYNRALDNYITSIAESRQLLRSMISVLVQQETTIQTIIRSNTVSSQHDLPIAPSNVPIQPIWQSHFVRRTRETTDNVLPSRPNPIIDSSLNPTEDLMFANVPENDRYESCPITYEEFNNESEITRIRHCGHYFSRQAITRWLTTNNHCPICRHAIRPETTTNVNRETMIDNMLDILTRDLLTDNRPGAVNSLIFHVDIADNAD